jgi:gliding motility-associated protein GldL
MAKKTGFLESKAFKLFMKYAYGIGAAVVILGALFKIMHWKFANEMLIAGMSTEVFIFFVSAFEPLHPELDWARVYPQLAEDTDADFLLEENKDEMSAEEALAMAEKGMKEIEITPELFESLSGSLNGLKGNVEKLANIEDATIATSNYASNVREATSKIGELNNSYTNTMEAMSNLNSTTANVMTNLSRTASDAMTQITSTAADAMNSIAGTVGNAAQNAQAYQDQISQATSNLTSLNAIYQMEIADAKKHMESISSFYEGLANVMNNMMAASSDTEEYKAQVSALAGNLRTLNNIYGGMLSAMSAASRG